jgi:hypothetical protein
MRESPVAAAFSDLARLFAPAALLDGQPHSLDIYWIHVEGGAATLIVSPSGESMLIHIGWEGGRPGCQAALCGHTASRL